MIAGPSPSVGALLRADMAAAASLKGCGPFPSRRALADVLTLPGTWAVLIHRLSAALHRRGHRLIAFALASLDAVLFSTDIHPSAKIGPGLVLAHPYGVVIGPATVGREARLMGNVRIGGMAADATGEIGTPVLGDDCWLFDGAVVIGDVRVGDRSVVSTNAVVTRDLPANAIGFGDPARVIRYRSSPAESPAVAS